MQVFRFWNFRFQFYSIPRLRWWLVQGRHLSEVVLERPFLAWLHPEAIPCMITSRTETNIWANLNMWTEHLCSSLLFHVAPWKFFAACVFMVFELNVLQNWMTSQQNHFFQSHHCLYLKYSSFLENSSCFVTCNIMIYCSLSMDDCCEDSY
jgi:hypothetical protein